MKKTLLALLLLSGSLHAATFEEEHREEIIKIIQKYKNKYPDDYGVQKRFIQFEIEDLKKVYEIRKQYGVE